MTSGSGEKLDFRAIPSHDYTQIMLPSPQTHVTIDFTSAGDLTVYGAMLSGDRPGLFYHAIGNNGAAYGDLQPHRQCRSRHSTRFRPI